MKIEKMTDEQALAKFIELLEKRVSITTGFAQAEQEGNLTHQFLRVRCGDLEVVSQPEELDVPLRVVTAAESGATIN